MYLIFQSIEKLYFNLQYIFLKKRHTVLEELRLHDVGRPKKKIKQDEFIMTRNSQLVFTKDSLQDIFYYLPNLKFFSFPLFCQNEFLECIADFCPNIEIIDITGSYITSESLKKLGKKENGKACCSKLKELYIDNCSFHGAEIDEGVEYLIQNLPSLECITYWNLPRLLYSMHKSYLSQLDKVEPYNITRLNLFKEAFKLDFTNLLQICVFVCPRLKHLRCALSNQQELDLLSKLHYLEILFVDCCPDSDLNINELLKSSGGKLSSLTVRGFTLSASVLAKSCPCLKILCIENDELIGDFKLETVFQSLESCTFESAYKDSGAAKAVSLLLSSSPKLESISFKWCQFSSETNEHILRACQSHSIKIIDWF